LVNTSGNKDQTVTSGVAIAPIVFTWGGDATDVTFTGVTNGLSFAKDTTAKIVIITGTPTQTTAYTVTTVGAAGTSASINGTITVGNTGNPGSTDGLIHNFTTSEKLSTFYTITGNMNSTDGSQTYDGLSLTKRFKMESATSINYTTTDVSTLTLVFDADFAKKVKFDGVNYTAVNGVVTIPNVAAGAHSITKGDTTNLYYIKTAYATTLATRDINKSEVSLYPNPVSDYLYFNVNGQKIINIKVYNFAGSLVKNNALVNGNSIDLRSLNTGNYIVSITTENGTVTKKIIKK